VFQSIIPHFPAIIVVLPLVMSFFVFFSGWWFKRWSFFIAVGALVACLLLAISLFQRVLAEGVIQYRMGGWDPPWGIEYRIDHLTICMILLIAALSMVTAIFAKRLVELELSDRPALFWCLYLLLTTGLLGIALTADLFNLFVLLEVASLTSYALVAAGRGRAKLAGFRYLLVGTIGATFYLIGVGYLYIITGTLNMEDLRQLLPPLYDSRVVQTGFLFILFGIGIKTALFPLHVWLPDAYTYAPSSVSALLAPLMTKVMAYVVIRVMFTVFTVQFSILTFQMNAAMVWLGVLAILFGGVMALSQSDYKRMLSYVIIAEIGFIIGGIGVANATALKGAIFHIINDALMMGCLFLVAGIVTYRTKGQRVDDFRGLFRSMPITAAIFTVGALAVIGVPPTCGFFSKWYLLLGAIDARQWPFVAALLICTLINVALFFRIIDKGLYVHSPDAVPDKIRSVTALPTGEAPLSMLLPASVFALAILLIGIFNQNIINKVIRFTVPAGF
jgi:multicomponent Na+:H+ antiporter subunit D